MRMLGDYMWKTNKDPSVLLVEAFYISKVKDKSSHVWEYAERGNRGARKLHTTQAGCLIVEKRFGAFLEYIGR
jgi:hypothetical protein